MAVSVSAATISSKLHTRELVPLEIDNNLGLSWLRNVISNLLYGSLQKKKTLLYGISPSIPHVNQSFVGILHFLK